MDKRKGTQASLMGILAELTGQRRNRIFMFERYLAMFEERGQRESG